ncbi:MAG: hypothetical protein FJ265_17915 [Planctomycetes bacterium]|nr:hypothetical protein [Planctomycetota bacterium]
MARSTALLLLLAGCAAAPGHSPSAVGPRPEVPVATVLPAGALLLACLAAGTPDEPSWRAAEVWWREALRQSVRFDVLEPGTELPGACRVELAIDPAKRALAATARLPDGAQRVLAGGSFAGTTLAAAIDRLAWATRLALGEEAAPPVPVGAAVSADERAVLAAHDALLLLRDGGVESARRALQQARARDGGSPHVLDAVAAVALLRGDPAQAERTAPQALGFTARLSPPVQHRLARTLLLARASLHPDRADRHDRELLALGEAGRRERPHDPQPALTAAIARNFLGEFAAARPLLEAAAARLPNQAVPAYHLGWACLATGDARGAAAWFEAAALRLPAPWVAIPRAIALHRAGDDDGLAALLARLPAEDDAAPGTMVHDLRRMQAAHALLRGRTDEAAVHALADLRWLCAHPTALDLRAGELAEQGEVLVRLGRGAELPPMLAALQAQQPGTAVADACAYLQGLVQVAARAERAEPLEAQLARGGESAFALRLQAFAHERRGELGDLLVALGRAAQLSDSPLTKALLARALAQSGRTAEAAALRGTLRAELDAIHLRRRPQHPLLGPELAYAYLLE